MNDKEFELEAMNVLKSKWSHLYQFGYLKKPFPTNYENDLNNVIIGLTSKYVEKQKLEFAIEQLKSFSVYQMPENGRTWQFKRAIIEKIQELKQKLSKL